MSDIEYRRGGGDDVVRLIGPIADLYEAAYAEPPYGGGPLFSRERFLERTGRQRHNDGFEIVTAHDGDELAGFAFGFTFPPGRWWGGATTPDPPIEVVDNSTFAVIELVVGPTWRGHGVARTLMDALLNGRPEPQAMLLSEPDAPARQIYKHWGWVHVADVRPADDAPAMHALVKSLQAA